MSHRERFICVRVKEFREAIKWPQRDFAEQLGISLNRLASIEYGRTPLRYEIAWKIRFISGLNLTWLANGFFQPTEKDLDPWPNPEDLPNGSYLLSEIEGRLWSPGSIKARAHNIKNSEKSPPNQRSVILSILKDDLTDWIAAVPDQNFSEFSDMLVTIAQDYLDNLPKDDPTKVAQRRAALVWEVMRLDIARRHVGERGGEINLTKTATNPNLDGVKSLWPALKRQLQSATAATGKKSELAKFLKVDLTRVSQWLTDKKTAREPGAEYALQMQRWVSLQKGLQK